MSTSSIRSSGASWHNLSASASLNGPNVPVGRPVDIRIFVISRPPSARLRSQDTSHGNAHGDRDESRTSRNH